MIQDRCSTPRLLQSGVGVEIKIKFMLIWLISFILKYTLEAGEVDPNGKLFKIKKNPEEQKTDQN